uniref:TRIM2_3 n=1 Tax=Schistosoma mansoni TaxID=6183 RepID=A0A5K4F9T4_SCHMA
MLNFEENVIINDENDIGSDQETNCSYSEHSNQTASIEIASMSSTISTLNTLDHALISTKVIDNSCNKQQQLMNLLNSDFLSCSFCHANDNVIKLLPCLHTVCRSCAISLNNHSMNQDNSAIKCKACHIAGLKLQKQYDPHNNNSFVNETLENNYNDEKYSTVQPEINSTTGSNCILEKEETSTVDELQFPNAIFIEKLRDLANLLQKETIRKCDYCMFENQNSEAQCRCIECGDNLCEPCAQAHKRTRITRLHTLLSYEDILVNGFLLRMREAPPTQCTDHEFSELNTISSNEIISNNQNVADNTVRNGSTIVDHHNNKSKTIIGHRCNWPSPSACFYCKSCNKLFKEHENHVVLSLEKAVHDAKIEINKQIDRVKRNSSQFENYLNNIVKYGHELSETELKITNQIQDRAEQLKKEIDQIANKLLNQLDKEIENEMKSIDHCAGSLPEEVLSCFDQVNKQLSYLGQKKIEYLKARIKTYFKSGGYSYCEDGIETKSKTFNSSYLFGSIESEKIVEEFSKNEIVNRSTIHQQNELKLELSNIYLNPDQISVGVNTSPRELETLTNYHEDNRYNNNDNELHLLNSDNRFKTNESFLTSGNGYTSDNAKHKSMVKEQYNQFKCQVTNELEFDARVSTDLRDVWPTGLAVNQSNGDIYVVDRDNSRIKLFTHDGTFISSLGDTGEMTDRLISPFDITLSSSRGIIFVSDYQRDEIRLFSFDGRSQGILTKNKLKHPRGVCYGIGLLAVVESRRHHISLYDIRCDTNSPVHQIPVDKGLAGEENNSNKFIFNSRTALTEPYYVEFVDDGGGCLGVTDWAAPSVKLYSLKTGSFLSSIGGYGTTNDNILQPYGICYAPWMKSFLIADHVNHRIQSCQIKHINENDTTILTNDFNRSIKQTNGLNQINVNGHKITSINLSSLKLIAEKGTHSIWHPMAITTDVQRKRIIVTEALGNVKVLKSMEAI